MSGELQISSSKVEVFKLRGAHSLWADVTVDEWKGGGALSIQSDFGNWSYSWRAAGEGRFYRFLGRLDQDYFWGKLTSRGNWNLFDPEKTLQSFIDNLLEARACVETSEQATREVYDALVELKKECPGDSESFGNAIRRINDEVIGRSPDWMDEYAARENALERAGIRPWWEMSTCTMHNPILLRFWNEIWGPLKNFWKENGYYDAG